jgi:hypothetical protein
LGLAKLNSSKPVRKVKISSTYKHTFRSSLIQCGTLNAHFHAQHYWVWCVDIKGGPNSSWPYNTGFSGLISSNIRHLTHTAHALDWTFGIWPIIMPNGSWIGSHTILEFELGLTQPLQNRLVRWRPPSHTKSFSNLF